MMRKRRIKYIILSGVLLIAECLIGRYASGVIRIYGGDLLVIPLLYCFVRIVTDRMYAVLPLICCGIGFLTELMQFLHICDVFGLHGIFRIVIGTQGDAADLICYTAGTLLIYFVMLINRILMGGNQND